MISRKLLWHHEPLLKQKLTTVATKFPLFSTKRLILCTPGKEEVHVQRVGSSSLLPRVTQCLREASGQHHTRVAVTLQVPSEAALPGTAGVMRYVVCWVTEKGLRGVGDGGQCIWTDNSLGRLSVETAYGQNHALLNWLSDTIKFVLCTKKWYILNAAVRFFGRGVFVGLFF